MTSKSNRIKSLMKGTCMHTTNWLVDCCGGYIPSNSTHWKDLCFNSRNEWFWVRKEVTIVKAALWSWCPEGSGILSAHDCKWCLQNCCGARSFSWWWQHSFLRFPWLYKEIYVACHWGILSKYNKMSDEDIEGIDAQIWGLKKSLLQRRMLAGEIGSSSLTGCISILLRMCWSPLGREYNGGLATVMPGTRLVEADFYLFNWTRDLHSKALADFCLESIIHQCTK